MVEQVKKFNENSILLRKAQKHLFNYRFMFNLTLGESTVNEQK